MTSGVENPQRATSHLPKHLAENLGPKCRGCLVTEARCAWVGGCCDACGHWSRLDAHGNDKPKPTVAIVVRIDRRPICPMCSRRVSPRGRFDCPGVCSDVRRAYDRARPRRAS